jgi:hypothetical protein
MSGSPAPKQHGQQSLKRAAEADFSAQCQDNQDERRGQRK